MVSYESKPSKSTTISESIYEKTLRGFDSYGSTIQTVL